MLQGYSHTIHTQFALQFPRGTSDVLTDDVVDGCGPRPNRPLQCILRNVSTDDVVDERGPRPNRPL